MTKTRSTVLSIVLSGVTLAGCSSSHRLDDGRSPAPPPVRNEAATAELRRYVDENFGGSDPTVWYPAIIVLWVEGDTAVALTNRTERHGSASSICSALAGFVNSKENQQFGLRGVRILGADNRRLFDLQGITLGECSAG